MTERQRQRHSLISTPSYLPGQDHIVDQSSCSNDRNGTSVSNYSSIISQQMKHRFYNQQTSMERMMQHQSETTKSVALKLGMPKREFLFFDGDPVVYPVFIKNFEVNVEQQIQDDCLGLSYLVQHCTGVAKQAIKNCTILPLNQSLKEARQILLKNFGQKHNLVHAVKNKVGKEPQIKPSEVEKLLQLALDMKNCHLISSEMNSKADIDSIDTLEKVVRRLPSYLQAEWTKTAGKLICSGVEPELMKFLEDRTR
ncbi:uncharacterized protein LOC144357027 [Saccoglossus kowalevskii]